jgi:hypothetical protein
MADVVRCSMCGKENPAGADTCQYCGARLTPVRPPAKPGGNEPDWLNQLRSNDSSDATSSEPPSAGAQPGDADVPDWLSRVRQRNQSESEEPTPDWLQGLVQPANQEGTSPAVSTPGNDIDWLSGLRDQVEETPAAPVQPEASSNDLTGEDWLSNLNSALPGSSQPQQATPSTPSMGETQDWLNQLQNFQSYSDEPGPAAAAAPAAGTPSESDFSSWLQGLDESKPAAMNSQPLPDPAVPAQNEPAAPSADLNAWLASLGGSTPTNTQEVEPQTSAGTDLPDWLAGQATSSIEEPTSPTSAAGETELPGWLAGQAANELEATPAEPSRLPAADVPTVPDWLSGQDSAPIEAAPTEPDSGMVTMPDWLGSFNADEPVEPEINASQSPANEPEPGVELPGWVSAVGQDWNIPAGESAAEVPQQGLPSSEEQRAWMMGVDKPEEAAQETAGQAAPSPDFASLFGRSADLLEPASEPSQEEPEGEVPDWLKNFGRIAGLGLASADVQQPEAPATGQQPFVDEDLPAWLSEVKQPAGGQGQGVPPLIEPRDTQPEIETGSPFKVDLPEWMDQPESPAEENAPEVVEAEQPAEALAKADLPSWVEDMRPLESVLPGDVQTDTSDTHIEKAGPLAGMRGLLPGEELATRYRKPPIYSARLNVSERQRQHAQLLDTVLSIESKPQERPGEGSRAPQMVVRLIMALLLVLALLPMLLPGFELLPVPTAYPAGLTAMYDRIENLPANAPVLLAMDYEPGLSGEMKFAANAVIEHLMVKNARMIIVSTVPTGPVLAAQMLTEVNARRPDYSLDARTLNLGYMAGGTTSLLEFARNPRAAAPVALSGETAWDRPVVADISKLTDFALVIVMTDTAETGRAWIEQVKREMGGVPLTMVTSAQAEPLLLPYLDSDQIQGITSGLAGGAMYEQKSGRMNLANQFWGSYQSGSLAGVLLLVVGGVFSVILTVTGQSRKKKA